MAINPADITPPPGTIPASLGNITIPDDVRNTVRNLISETAIASLTGEEPSSGTDLVRFDLMGFAGAAHINALGGINFEEANKTAEWEQVRSRAVDALLRGQSFGDDHEAWKAATREADKKITLLQHAIETKLTADPKASFADVYASAMEEAGIEGNLSDLNPHEKDYLEAFEERRRELLHLGAAAAERDGTETETTTPAIERPNIDLDQAKDRIPKAVDTAFDDATKAGLISFASPKEEYQQRAIWKGLGEQGRLEYTQRYTDPNISQIGTEGIYTVIGAVEGSFNTIDAALSAGYKKYKETPAASHKSLSEWSADEVNQFLKNGVGVLAEAGETFTDEAVTQYYEQRYMTSERAIYRMMGDTYELATKGNRYHMAKDGHWKLKDEIVEAWRADPQLKDMVARLDAATMAIKRADGTSIYEESEIALPLVVDEMTQDSRRMATALTLGVYNKTKYFANNNDIPLSMVSFNKGATIAQAVHPKYKEGAGMAAKWSENGQLVPSYAGQDTTPIQYDTPPEAETDDTPTSGVPAAHKETPRHTGASMGT